MPQSHTLSFQLYSLRTAPLGEQVALLQRLGYRNVETVGALYEDLDATAAALQGAGLAVPSGHFAMGMLETDPGRVVSIARRLGITTAVMPYILPDDRPTDRAGWTAFGERLARVSARLKGEGLRFAYHNHDFEFKALPDGSLPIEHCLGTDILWEADLAWIVRGGGDPLEWLAHYKGRVPLVHAKDIAAPGDCLDEDGWADVGHGTIGWDRLWPAAVAAGAEIFIAEHDKPNDGERFARRALAAMTAFDAGAH